jgi:hypothetical protein
MNKLQILGDRMMTVALTYPNDKIANEFSRVGDLLAHQGLPFVKKLTKLDIDIVKYFQNVQKVSV